MSYSRNDCTVLSQLLPQCAAVQPVNGFSSFYGHGSRGACRFSCRHTGCLHPIGALCASIAGDDAPSHHQVVKALRDKRSIWDPRHLAVFQKDIVERRMLICSPVDIDRIERIADGITGNNTVDIVIARHVGISHHTARFPRGNRWRACGHIEEIAQSVGYGNADSFRRAFKRAKGVSPRQYRETI